MSNGIKRMVLCGGGHSHVLALPYLMQHSPPNVEWLLISDSPDVPYSGMLPGFIGGQFTRAQCLINLPKLCAAHGITWQQGKIKTIENNAHGGVVHLHDGHAISFNVLSVNIGGTQTPLFTPKDTHTITVKPALPLMDFVDALPSHVNNITNGDNIRIAVVGAGAGGCEIAMALRRRLPSASMQLVGKCLLPNFNVAVRDKIANILQKRDIEFCAGTATASTEQISNSFNINGKENHASHIIFATAVQSAAHSIIPSQYRTLHGGIAIDSHLQIIDNVNKTNAPIFAAGDCAELHKSNTNIAKSGVVAVRQAPILAHNIIACINKLDKQQMKNWQPKKHFLYILNTANERAIANWGRVTLSGKSIWTWKKYLDLGFMRRVTDIYTRQ